MDPEKPKKRDRGKCWGLGEWFNEEGKNNAEGVSLPIGPSCGSQQALETSSNEEDAIGWIFAERTMSLISYDIICQKTCPDRMRKTVLKRELKGQDLAVFRSRFDGRTRGHTHSLFPTILRETVARPCSTFVQTQR